MTKADRIRSLDNGKRSTSEIADIVGCRPEYVRVVLRQRVNGISESDKRYRERNPAYVQRQRDRVRERNYQRYHTDPEYRARVLKAWRERYHRERSTSSA